MDLTAKGDKMIEILDTPKHLVGFKISGSLTADDVDKAYKATEKALKENERISFIGEVDRSASFTFEGLAKDLWEGLGQLGKLSRYYRAAVVTDKGWIAAMARVEGIVFSSVQVRVFDPSERDKAYEWASEKPEPLPNHEDPEASLRFIQTTSGGVFAYEIDGRLREKDIKNAVKEFSSYLEKEGKVNVLARLTNFHGFDLTAIFDDDLAKMKYRSLSKVERYAVVGAPTWMQNLMELIAPAFSTKIRFFEPKEEDEAWEWVGARQALLTE